MAAQGRQRQSLRKGSEEQSLLSRVSQSGVVQQTKRAANDASLVTKKLMKSTGKAAWILGTTFLILGVPLIIAMDREQQFNELELQQANILGSSSSLKFRVLLPGNDVAPSSRVSTSGSSLLQYDVVSRTRATGPTPRKCGAQNLKATPSSDPHPTKATASFQSSPTLRQNPVNSIGHQRRDGYRKDLKSVISAGLAAIASCDYNLMEALTWNENIVEIDPLVISASVKAMGFPAFSVVTPSGKCTVSKPDTMDEVLWKCIHERLFLYESDAEEFILNNTSLYDMIFIDAYDGEDIFPHKLWDPHSPFLKALSNWLRPEHGTVVVNLHSDTEILNPDGSAPSVLQQTLPMGKYVSGFAEHTRTWQSGLVNEGLPIYSSLSTDFEIKPAVEICACVVDLLGRSVTASVLHGNHDMQDLAYRFLIQLEPKNPSNYISLSNFYASSRRWDVVAEMRRMMKERGLKKAPGCS
ncbi:unnamed protein product [Prunus brigantina]